MGRVDPAWATGIAAGEAWDALTSIDLLTAIDALTSQQDDATSVSDYDTYRNLIVNSVPLHRLRGTPAAIITALTLLGFGGAILQEGQHSWGGTSWPAAQGWAVFRVVINLAAGQLVTAKQQTQIRGAALFWKNARSWLDAINYVALPLTELVLPAPTELLIAIFLQQDLLLPAPTELVLAPFAPLVDTKNVQPLHYQRYLHIGTTYGPNQPVAVDSGVVVNGVAISALG